MVSLRLLQLTNFYQTIAVIILSAVCLLAFADITIAVFSAGLITSVNFWALRVLATKALLGPEPKPALLLALALKMSVTAALLAVLILVWKQNVVGIALGMSTLFMGLAVAMGHTLFTPPRISNKPLSATKTD